jgi:glutamine cyclotransferase
MTGPDGRRRGPAASLICLLAGMIATLCFPSTGAERFREGAPGQRGCGTPGRVHYAQVSSSATVPESAPDVPFEVIARYPHDETAFTQGLVFYRGELYESTGRHGQSSVRRLELKSGRILNRRLLNAALFGEGLTLLDHRLVQLTWKSGSAFFYAPADLRQTGGFAFSGEGWGSTVADGRLVISDGSPRLRFFDGTDYRHVASLEVTEHGRPVEGLNELESAGKLIYANVYPSDCIARIDVRSGHVVGWIDLGGLMPLSERPDSSAVANGIAYNPGTGALFVTGKLWPHVFQLRLLQTESVPGRRTAAVEERLQR